MSGIQQMLLFLGGSQSYLIGLLSGVGNQRAYNIVSDSSNNIYVMGKNSSNGIQIAKYNSSGTIQWQQSTSSSDARGVAIDSSANLYAVGLNGATAGVEIVKYNSSGVVQWQVSFNASATGFGISTDSSANVYIATYVNTGTYNDILLAKYNASGVL